VSGSSAEGFLREEDSRNGDFEGYRPYEGFAERRRRQNTRFDCVAERTGKQSEEIALGHFAQNETA